MSYKFLAAISGDYGKEEGEEASERPDALKALETLLQGAMRAAATWEEYSKLPREARIDRSRGIRGLILFHEREQACPVQLTKARAEVIRIRKWLVRQGAVLSIEGRVDLLKSARKVVYDRDLKAQGMTKVEIRGGRLVTAAGKSLDTKHMATAHSGPGYAVFVLSVEGNLHVSSHSVGHRHHSSLLAGASVAGAGELRASDGRLTFLSNKSGHYMTDVVELLQVLHHLEKYGVPMSFPVTVIYGAGDQQAFPTVDAFLLSVGANDSSYEWYRLMRYSDYLTPEILGPHGWEYRPGAAVRGVYHAGTETLVEPREVRRWLRSQGHKAAVSLRPADDNRAMTFFDASGSSRPYTTGYQPL